MYTIATVQLHVQTLLDPSIVHVAILILEMEKHAALWQVNMSLLSCFAVQCLECHNSEFYLSSGSLAAWGYKP